MTHSGDSAHGWYLVPVPPMIIIRVDTAEEARSAPTGRRVILEVPWHVANELGLCFDERYVDATTWEDALWDADAPIDENGVVVDCQHPAHRIRYLENWCRCDVCHAWAYIRWEDCMMCGRQRLPSDPGEPPCCGLDVPPEPVFTSDWREWPYRRSFRDGG